MLHELLLKLACLVSSLRWKLRSTAVYKSAPYYVLKTSRIDTNLSTIYASGTVIHFKRIGNHPHCTMFVGRPGVISESPTVERGWLPGLCRNLDVQSALKIVTSVFGVDPNCMLSKLTSYLLPEFATLPTRSETSKVNRIQLTSIAGDLPRQKPFIINLWRYLGFYGETVDHLKLVEKTSSTVRYSVNFNSTQLNQNCRRAELPLSNLPCANKFGNASVQPFI